MDFSTFYNSIQGQLGHHLPGIVGALAVLIGGWIIAVIVRAGLNRFLNMVGINKRISESTGQEVDLASGISFGAFVLILLITMIGVFSSLNLQAVSEPFNVMVSQIFEYLPNIFAGLILLGIAWGIATLVRVMATKALATTKLDERLSADAHMQPMSNNVGNMLFWIIILMFLPALLSAFELNGLLAPVQGMVDKFLAMVPNIFAGGVIALVGWIVAKILSGLVTNILATSGIDNVTKKAGIKDTSGIKLSNVVGMVVFIFVFIPTLIAALDALQMESISRPASDMLGIMFAAIPNILAAAVILTITYYVAKFVASLVVNLLSGIGFNSVPAKLGFADTFTKKSTVSDLVGKVIVFFALLFATVEAANRLGFSQVSDIIGMFIQFGGDILLGSVILLIGFWLANMAYNAIDRASGKKSKGLANIARLAIIGLVVAMGLRAMGIADDIVNMAFGLTLGSVAVAVALAFGLGGREAAGKQLEYWFSKMRDGK
ncbi:MAG: mechanosensitive ion channel [Methylophilaceae bacterium]